MGSWGGPDPGFPGSLWPRLLPGPQEPLACDHLLLYTVLLARACQAVTDDNVLSLTHPHIPVYLKTPEKQAAAPWS